MLIESLMNKALCGWSVPSGQSAVHNCHCTATELELIITVEL